MTTSSIKLFTSRLMIVAGFCLVLCNCGNKSALFLESSVPVENTTSDKSIKTNNNHSEEESISKGEQTP